jgi:hypothetical protein
MSFFLCIAQIIPAAPIISIPHCESIKGPINRKGIARLKWAKTPSPDAAASVSQKLGQLD